MSFLDMSGFEIVGVVLAVFPVITHGLKFYSEGTGLVNDLFHYQHVLKRIGRGLAREQTSFSNSCRRFMEDVANQCGVGEEDIAEMMQDPTDPRWREGDLVKEHVFRQKSVQEYLDTVEDMNEELAKIRDLTAIDADDGQVSLLSIGFAADSDLNIPFSPNRSIKSLVVGSGRRSSSCSRRMISPDTLKKPGA